MRAAYGSLFRGDGLQYVESRGTPRRPDRGDPAEGRGENHQRHERHDRESEVVEALVVQRLDDGYAETATDDETEHGAVDSHDDRLHADHVAHLPAGKTDGAQQSKLARALDNGQHEC